MKQGVGNIVSSVHYTTDFYFKNENKEIAMFLETKKSLEQNRSQDTLSEKGKEVHLISISIPASVMFGLIFNYYSVKYLLLALIFIP